MSKALFQSFWNKYVWQTRNFSLSDPKILDIFGSNATASGEKVSEQRGLGITAVYTSINILMQTIGSIPFSVKQKTDNGRVTLETSPIHYLIHDQPNEYMSSYEFWSSMIMWLMGWGNAFALISRDFRNDPASFSIVNPWDIDIRELNGEYFYYYKSQLIESRDLIHLRVFSKNGIVGMSPIMQNREAMGLIHKEDRYAGMAYGAKPPGYLTYDGIKLDTEQEKDYAESWRKSTSGDNIGRTPVLKGGFKYNPILIPPGDAEYIASRQLSDTKVYGIYRIPPTFAQNYERATFSNAEQQDIVFAKYTALPIVTMIERECNMKLFPPSNRLSKDKKYIKGNLKSLLQGDLNARKEFYQAMIHAGVLSPNDVLRLEDMNTYEGGERRYIQSGSIPVDRADDFIDSKTGKDRDTDDLLKDFNFKKIKNGEAVQ